VDLRTVTVGDVELSLAEAGAGGRPLLLIHGFTGAKEDFTDFLDRLAALGWHAVAPDNRGHGSSAMPSEEDAYSFEIFAADCFGVADAIGWDRFVALGHSMGGMILQFMLTSAPERLEAIILMDTAHSGLGLPADDIALAVAIVRDAGIHGLADILATREGPLTTPAHERLLAEKPGYAEFADRKLRASAAAMYASMVQTFVSSDDRLAELADAAPIPALVLVGEQDQPFIGPSKRMAEALDAELVVVPDAGHSPQFENPDAWWTAVSDFLSKLP
jgi:pimeloyl-ACP methyl ester carboxylesterase